MKNFTKQNFKTNPLWIRLLIMTFMLLIGTGSAWAWGYKSAGGSWEDCTGSFSNITYYTEPTGITTKSLDVIMKTNPGSGFNICQNACSGQQLYVGLTGTASSSANTIVRGTAYWNNGLYSTYTVVIPEGKIYIKPTGGSAIEMTKSSYTYTASVQLSSAKTFDLYANDPGASISNESSMPSAGKPSSVRLNYTGLSSLYQYVKITYDLKTNQITFEEEDAPCDPQSPTFVHTNSSYNEISTPTYYLGDKAYFKSTINCCLTGDWSKTGTGTYKTLTGTTPNFYLTLSSVGSFTLTNAATDGCDGSTSPSISFTTQALPNPTAQSASISGTTASLSWTKDATYTTVMVVRYAKGATPTAPTQGTSYAVNGTIGTGKVVYKDTGTSYTNTGLTAGSSYDYYFYTVNNNYYSAGVKATAEGCTLPNVQISNLSSTTLCTGGSLTFNYTAAAGANVTFKMGTNPSHFTINGDGSNSGTVTIKYNSSTTINNNPIKYDVSGTDICALTGQSTGKTIDCGPKPSIDATSATSFSFCPGDAAVTLSVTADKGTYSWAKNGEDIAGETSNSIEVSEAGTYTVFVVGTGGCESNTVTFTVNGNGGPVVHVSGSSTLGANQFVALYVTDCSGKEITSYQWYKDGAEYSSVCSYTFEGKEKIDVVNPETGKTEKEEVKVTKTENGNAGTSNNIRATEAGNYTCKITYKDGSSKISEPESVKGTYSYLSSTIPVIVVNTNNVEFPGCQGDNETASKNASKMKEKLSVDVKIYDGSTVVYDRKARMAYRGSSSLNFQKKSYAFCPGKADCVEDKGRLDYVKTEKMNMLGIGKATDKDWVLYAAAADPSMLRNRMVFETYQAMRNVGVTEENKKEWGVNCRYVELIINGDYRGVYVMMDKITQNKNRVNVEWDVKDASKRGFILKFDKTDREDRVGGFEGEVGDEKTFVTSYSGKFNIETYDTTNDQAFEIEYPEKEDIEDESGNWDDVVDFIKGKVNEFETALAAGKFSEVQKVIDYESWADWFILNEFTKNVDAYRASCVFTFDGNKLKANPLWDQELSFNNQSVHANRTPSDPNNKGCENVKGLLINHDHVYTDGFAAPFWFTGTKTELNTNKDGCIATPNAYSGLLKDPCFVEVIKQRWNTHKTGALSYSTLNGLITEYKKELTDAVLAREAAFWTDHEYSRNTLSCSWSGHNTGYYDDSFTDAETDIQNWIKEATANGSTGRRDGLSKAITDELKASEISILIEPATISTTPWEPVTIQVQSESGYEYELTYEGDNPLNEVNDVIIEKNGNAYKYHIPRPINWGVGDPAEGVRTPIDYVIKATLKVGEEGNVCGSTTDGGAPFSETTITLKDEDNDGCQ